MNLSDIGEFGLIHRIAPQFLENVNNYGDSLDLIGGPIISYDGNTLYFFAETERVTIPAKRINVIIFIILIFYCFCN